GFQHVTAFHLPHAVILPGTDVVGIGGKRLFIPNLGGVIVSELAARIADVIRDIGAVVDAKLAHAGDAGRIFSFQDQGARLEVTVAQLKLGLLALLLVFLLVAAGTRLWAARAVVAGGKSGCLR